MSDRGGCFFLNGAPSQFARQGTKSVMVLPLPAIKWIAPSWLFILQDIKVNGRSIKPCLIPPLCRAVIKTGVFSITGPMYPMLALLEEVAAPSTCEGIDRLPDITFTIMGTDFTMTRHDYVIFGQDFDEISCMTAFTPEAQLIPGFELWTFGDAFIRAFYTTFSSLPLHRLAMGPSEHRYYEKNGCGGGEGEGPLRRWDGGGQPPPGAARESGVAAASASAQDAADAAMGWKRRQNWEADQAGVADAAVAARADAALRDEEGARFAAARHTKFGLGLATLTDTAPGDGVVRSASDRFGLNAAVLLEADAGMADAHTAAVHDSPPGLTPADTAAAWAGSHALADAVHESVRLRASAAADREARGRNAAADLAQSLAHPVAVAALAEIAAGGGATYLARHDTAAAVAATVGASPAVVPLAPTPPPPPPPPGARYWDYGGQAPYHLHTADLSAHARHPDPWVAYVAATAPLLPALAAAVPDDDGAGQAALLRNMSVVLGHMARVLNVSDATAAKYWRGESPEWEDAERARALARYKRQLAEARATAAAQYAASHTALEVLRRVAADLTVSREERLGAVQAALGRMGLLPADDDNGGGGGHDGNTGGGWASGEGAYPYVRAAALTPEEAAAEAAFMEGVAGFPPPQDTVQQPRDGGGEPQLVRSRDGEWQLDAAPFEAAAAALLSIAERAVGQHETLWDRHTRAAHTMLRAAEHDADGLVLAAGEPPPVDATAAALQAHVTTARSVTGAALRVLRGAAPRRP